MRTGATLAVLAIVIAACGGTGRDDVATSPSEPAASTAPGEPASAPSDGLLVRCGELDEVVPPPGSFADTPVYVGNEQPIEEVRRWASQRPGFQQVWIDRDNNGWLVVGFTEQVDQARSEAGELFPDDGVAVVEVPRSLDELAALQAEVHERVPEVQTSSADIRNGHVEVRVAYLTEQLHRTLSEEFRGQPVCVEGGDPADAPPRTQPQRGDGWRLLAAVQRPPFERPPDGLATTSEQLERLVAGPGIDDVPLVDFADEVVVLRTEDHGSACPELVLTDVVVEDGPTVRVVLADPERNVSCTDDLVGSWAFLVAVERDLLPSGSFAFEGAFGGTVGIVTTDLSEPGATLAPGEFTPPERPDGRVRSGAIVETGFPADYAFDVSCSAEALGVLNDVTWVATAEDLGPGGVPQAWRAVAEDDGTVTLEVVIEPGDPPTLTATANDQAVTYQPGDRAPC